MKHKCKPMIRDENLRTPLGQAAWLFYQEWMRLQRKRVPNEKSFLKSSYYESFNRFSKNVKKLHLPSPQMFMKLMVERGFPPTMWTSNDTYAIYMEHLDLIAPPTERAKITIDTLDYLADTLGCDTGNIFAELNANEVIELIKERKLSPWILLHSNKFKLFFRDRTTPEQRVVLEAVIRYPYWSGQFQKQPKMTNFMLNVVKEMNL